MKILLTVDFCKDQINGVTNSVKTLQEELNKRGNDVRLLALSENHKSQIIDNNYYMGSVKCDFIYPGVRAVLFNDKKIEEEIEKWKPDIIHTQTEFFTYKMAHKISDKINIPRVHTLHTMYEEYYRYISENEKIGKTITHKLVDHIWNDIDNLIVPSLKVKNSALKKAQSNINTEVIPTGIDTKLFQTKLSKKEKDELLKKYQMQNGDIVLLYLGRISKEKNIEELLEIVKKANNINDKIKLLLVGDGPNKTSLEENIKKEKLENIVKFTGMIEPKEVYKYYHLGNIFVNSSTTETQGLTYVEALSSGLPLICRKDSCLENIIKDNYNGFQFETVEEAVNKILEFSSNTEKMANMGKNSLELAKQYSKEYFAESVENYYKKIIDKA